MTLSSATPTSAEEFGAALRQLRGRTGLRSLERRQDEMPDVFTIWLSRSQLSRYETGAVLPPVAHAEHLDALYQANGWVSMSLRNLWRPRWDPWAAVDEIPVRSHALEWPPRYAGAVWIKIVPATTGVGQAHEIVLDWGPWHLEMTRSVPREGIVITTGKSRDVDGVSVICNLTTGQPVFALHGTGDDLPGDAIVDVRRAWRKIQMPPVPPSDAKSCEQ